MIDLGGEVPRIGDEEAKVGQDGEIQHGPPLESQFKAESQGGSKFKIPQSARDGKLSPSQIQIQRRPGQGWQRPPGGSGYIVVQARAELIEIIDDEQPDGQQVSTTAS